MASQKQLAANRANAQKLTGPKTPEGKARARVNSLKTGLYSQLEALPWEEQSDLDTLTFNFYAQFAPATPEERALLDIVVRSEWHLRRTALVEANYWKCKRRRRDETVSTPDDHDLIGRDFTRIQWRLNSLQKNMFDALDRLRAAQANRAAPAVPYVEPEPVLPAPDSFADLVEPDAAEVAADTLPATEPKDPQPLSPKMGSFRSPRPLNGRGHQRKVPLLVPRVGTGRDALLADANLTPSHSS